MPRVTKKSPDKSEFLEIREGQLLSQGLTFSLDGKRHHIDAESVFKLVHYMRKSFAKEAILSRGE